MNRKLLFALIALIFIAHTIFFFVALGSDAVDDAYISFRYAQNALQGNGLVFNPGERVEGYTNFLWTALMIPVEASGVHVGRASMVLGVLFGLATLWLVTRFASGVSGRSHLGLFAAVLLAVDGSFALWSVAGLETSMFAFLIFAGALLYLKEQTPSPLPPSPAERAPVPEAERSGRVGGEGLPLSSIFFALAAMTRPEGVLVFALTVAHQAAWRVLTERRLWVARDLIRVALFATIFVPYFLGRWYYYKSFFPNSFYAKVAVGGPAAQLARGWNHLQQFVNVHLGWLIVAPALIALVGAVVWLIRGQRAKQESGTGTAFWITYFASVVVVYVAYIVYVGGDWSVGRFFVPLLAFFYLLTVEGLGNIWELVVQRNPFSWRKRVSGTLAVLLVLGILYTSSYVGEYGLYLQKFDAARATYAREAMGTWLRANVAPKTLIAVDAAGQVPYFSQLPAIDMFGINDVHIARLRVETLGQGTPGHEKFDLGYVLARQPQYVVIYGAMFDAIAEYERWDVAWTQDASLKEFLTLYRRK